MGSTTPSAPKDLKIGILVPSSNTALEPLTISLLNTYSPYNPQHDPSLPSITVHFSRLPVTAISLSPQDLSQFDTSNPADSPIIKAAKLLADANVDVIGWSGTSAGWLGFESDVKLCALVEQETGVRMTTSTLALNHVLEELGYRKGQSDVFGMITPYLDAVQSKIGEVYAKEANWEIVESHLGVSKNWDIAATTEETLEKQMAEVVKAQAGMPRTKSRQMVVSPFCTNLRAAHLAGKWEKEYEKYGLVVLDTVATVVWECLKMLGRPKGEIKGWGKLFEL
ncbi:uncharacterized protein AB675_7027 [Cyphellophora attinorum]|uniref:Arylmalonate decarboxylase n=1 Tax=Cyphellophora attinorum TaxID=1664694 RepID=A0A0N1P294_9EURO|nr:uncharacterized protein AB675_7027 [Phialophora attinorum]KPI43383.1 hypothetical protein AB675_7027 [Phialophora attinorum]